MDISTLIFDLSDKTSPYSVYEGGGGYNISYVENYICQILFINIYDV